jgi:MFS family permease
LWAFGFITFFSAFQLFPVIPLHIIELGGTKAQGGFFLAVYTYACAFAAPVTGTLADALGRKRVLIAASGCFVIFSLLYGVIPHWPLLLAVAVIHGVCWSAILSSSSAIGSELIPASRRTEGLAWWGLASTAAVSVAPFVGLMVYHFGWFILCAEMAVLSALMIVLATRIHDDHPHRRTSLPPLRQLIDFRVVATALALFVVSFSYGGITSYVALLSADRHIVPQSLFFTIFAITIIVTRVIIAPFADRWGALALLYPSLFIIPFALVTLAYSHDARSLVVAAVLYGIGFGGAYPAFMTYILGHTDDRRRASTFGSVLWAFDTGIGSGSLATGIMVGRLGYERAFLIAGAFSLLSIPIFLGTSRLLSGRRDELRSASDDFPAD